MQRKILAAVVVVLFIICGIYTYHVLRTIADVREAQYRRGIEFETSIVAPV